MSVVSRNPFADLGNDSDSDTAAPQRVAAGATGTAAAAGAAAAAPKSKTVPAAAAAATAGRKKDAKLSNNLNEQAAKVRNENRNKGIEPPPSGRGGRGGRGRRGREFDRHSGSGRVDTEKAVSQGWGSANDEIEDGAVVAKESEHTKKPATANWDENSAPKNMDDEVLSEPEVDNTITLDEYLAGKAKRQLAFDMQSKIRKPNEESSEAWDLAGKVVYKPETDDYYAGKPTGGGANEKLKSDKQRKEKITLDIEQKFTPHSSERGGSRGGRGGRGGESRGRGAGRGRVNTRGTPRGGRDSTRGLRGAGGRSAVAYINITDQGAFPDLA